MLEETKPKLDLGKLYSKQISFTEWFEDIKHSKTVEIRKEDNNKRERLAELNKIIGIPFDKPVEFNAVELTNKSLYLQKYIQDHGNELCALRLIPLEHDLPKLRMRGQTVLQVMKWYNEQKIDPHKYRAQFVPHANDYTWSTIFVVNKKGIFGEIIKGVHAQLTQGFYENAKPIIFYFDFFNWHLSEEDNDALVHLKEIIKPLRVSDYKLQQQIITQFNATISNNYIEGYFETTHSNDQGLWFVDWSRVIGELYENYVPAIHKDKQNSLESTIISGQIGSSGKASGIARIIPVELLDQNNYIFNDGDILICKMTSPDYVPLMKKASAIITDEGGILSHAAIICRELNIPCIVGTGNATQELKDGDNIGVDAEKGIVTKI